VAAAVLVLEDAPRVVEAAVVVVEDEPSVEEAAASPSQASPLAEEAAQLEEAPAITEDAVPLVEDSAVPLVDDAPPAVKDAEALVVEAEVPAPSVEDAEVFLVEDAAPSVEDAEVFLVEDAAPSVEDAEVSFVEDAAPSVEDSEVSFVEDTTQLAAQVPPLVEDAPPSRRLLEGRILPPMARRRPTRARSTSDLREAVADAVARAAAQGPLIPRGFEDEPEAGEAESDLSTAQGPAPLTSRTESSVEKTAPTASAKEQSVFSPPAPDSAETDGESYQELSGAQVATDAAATSPQDAALTAQETAESQPEQAGSAEIAALVKQARQDSLTQDSTASAPPAPEADSRPHQPEESTTEESPWPFGERRSAARQARKPLPAALQEAVAAGAAKDLESTQASSGDQKPTAKLQGSGGGTSTSGAVTSVGQTATSKRPGILRRYGSAIAIIVLFLAAAGAAAGIAAFRGPVAQPTAAQDQAAANKAVLTSAYFPKAWRVSGASSPASIYGLASALVTPSTVQNWLAGHKTCSTELNAVSSAVTPSAGDVTAVAYSQASSTNPLGGPWQIADAVAFHTSTAQVRTDLGTMRSVLGQARAQRCVAQFLTAALQSQLPAGPKVTMSVSPRTFPKLPGRPLGWSLEVIGTVMVGQSSLPLRCQITSFAAGRAQVFFVVSSKGAALPGNLATRVLSTLATRAQRLTSPTA
jgi:hypothetical protein